MEKVTCARNPVCARACMQKPTTWPRRDEMALVCPDRHVTLLQKYSNVHKKQGSRTHTQSTLFLITLLAGLTKSARMHKHANKTRAGAGNSDSCSWLNTATDAAAPGRAFPVSRQALEAPPRCRRQHTELDITNTPDKEDKARAQCEAPHCWCHAGSM